MDIGELVESVRDAQYWTPDKLLNAYGSSSAFAADLAGTSDKKSPAYKAALRNVQRWRQGTRKPNRATQEKLNEMGKKRFAPKAKAIKLDGYIRVNGSGKPRRRAIDIDLNEDEWQQLQEEAANDDVDSFLDILAEAYGVGSIEMEEGDASLEE